MSIALVYYRYDTERDTNGIDICHGRSNHADTHWQAATALPLLSESVPGYTLHVLSPVWAQDPAAQAPARDSRRPADPSGPEQDVSLLPLLRPVHLPSG